MFLLMWKIQQKPKSKHRRQVCTPAVRGDTLVATVLVVPVFALHGRVGAAGADADAPALSAGLARDGRHVHLHLHLRRKADRRVIQSRLGRLYVDTLPSVLTVYVW